MSKDESLGSSSRSWVEEDTPHTQSTGSYARRQKRLASNGALAHTRSGIRIGQMLAGRGASTDEVAAVLGVNRPVLSYPQER
jgi:hypothetical protein